MATREVKVNLVATLPPALVEDVDVHVWLQGDEDGGVGAQCRTCDRGGEAVAWYGLPNPYDEDRVPTALTIYGLYMLALQHVRQVHR